MVDAQVKTKILLAPHNDDEALFASFICLREKPLIVVVTDSWIQYNRGDKITAEERREESRAAATVLGCSIYFMGIRDDEITADILGPELRKLNADLVYAPAIQGGNKHHDLIGRLAFECFKNVVQYATYAKNELYTTGEIEVRPTERELELKNKALYCYKTQLSHPWTKPHFDAVDGKSEWLTKTKPWIKIIKYKLGL